MKKILLSILLILVFCSISAAAIKDSPNGFRDIKWGDPPTKLGERTKIEIGKFHTFYTKTRDKMSIGAADLVSIDYTFLQDRELMSVLIVAKEYYNASYLKDTMIARFGEPVTSEMDRCFWQDDDVYINYLYFADINMAHVYLASKKFLDKSSAIEKQAIEQGAKDF